MVAYVMKACSGNAFNISSSMGPVHRVVQSRLTMVEHGGTTESCSAVRVRPQPLYSLHCTWLSVACVLFTFYGSDMFALTHSLSRPAPMADVTSCTSHKFDQAPCIRHSRSRM